jgi:undecaprenyl-diphosphatase
MKNTFVHIKTLITISILIFCIKHNVYTCATNKTILLHKFQYCVKQCIEVIISMDHKIFKFVNSTLKCQPLDCFIIISNFAYTVTKFNYNLTVLIIFGSILIIWKYKKKQFYFNVFIFFIVLIISTISNYLCKSLCSRARPITCLGIENVNTILEKSYINSFPSGHTQIACTICAFMILIIKKYRLLYIVMTILIGFERIYVGSHFPLDVIAGAILGILITYLILTICKNFHSI